MDVTNRIHIKTEPSSSFLNCIAHTNAMWIELKYHAHAFSFWQEKKSTLTEIVNMTAYDIFSVLL